MQENNLANLATALVEVQDELNNTSKDTQGYGYKYTELSTILEQVKPILKKHGLAITQLPLDDGNGRVGVRTILMHKSGEMLESTLTLPIPDMKGTTQTQAAGAAITYARRYSVSAMLNISSEEDTDASAGKQDRKVVNSTTSTTTKTTQVEGVSKGFNSNAKATDKQKGIIYALAKEKGSDIDKIKRHYYLSSFDELTMAQASDIITKLKEKRAEVPKTETVTDEDLKGLNI